MIYNLTVQESYIVFNGLKNIYMKDISNNEVFYTYVKINNIYDITKIELSNLNNKYLEIDGLKIKWIESIEYKNKNIYLIFNIEIFKYLSNDFIEFIKKTNINFKYLGSYKLLELLFSNNKLLLNINDLYKIDCNTHLVLNNLNKELEELITLKIDKEAIDKSSLLEKDQINLINRIKIINRSIKEINEYKNIFSSKNIFDYCDLLKLFCKELSLNNINIKYKVKVINDEYYVKLKKIVKKEKKINKKEFKFNNLLLDLKEKIRQDKIKTYYKMKKIEN